MGLPGSCYLLLFIDELFYGSPRQSPWQVLFANKSNFHRSICYLLKKFSADMLAIFKTHAGGDRTESICRGLGFDNSYRVDAAGQSGGLWLLWRSVIGTVSIVVSSNQFI